MKANPGQLDQRVDIERSVFTDDGMGGKAETVSVVASVWALVSPALGEEKLLAGRVDSTALYRFTIRSRVDLYETDRIIWGGQRYNIRYLPRTGPRDLYLNVIAERGVAQ